jgi:hypothetical protein
MSETTDPKTETTPADAQAISAEDSVIRCCEAWNAAYAAEYPNRKCQLDAEQAATREFILAMPILSSEDSIRDFIACVTQGILYGAFKEKQASQLLYAAQVASGALTRARKLHSRKALHARKSAT